MVKKTSRHRFHESIDARRQQALFRIQTSVGGLSRIGESVSSIVVFSLCLDVWRRENPPGRMKRERIYSLQGWKNQKGTLAVC
jgi:hypothetical protein